MVTKRLKRIIAFAMSLVLMFSMTGCGSKADTYTNYVNSLLAANYLGNTGSYERATGTSQDDAEAQYQQNLTRLANNLAAFYDLDVSGDTELAPKLLDLAQKIYSKANFSVKKAKEDNNIYFVTVKISPINLLNQSEEAVNQYIDGFNQRIDAKEFDNYTKEQYEHEFAAGMIELLDKQADEITYADPVEVKVRIITTKDSFYISNDDFKALDAEIIKTVKTTSATPTDAEPQ